MKCSDKSGITRVCSCDVWHVTTAVIQLQQITAAGSTRGNGTTAMVMTTIWLWPQWQLQRWQLQRWQLQWWQLRRWQERQCDDNTTARTDDNRGLQLQNNTHNDEGYRVCVRIRMLCSIGWPQRRDWCEPGPNAMKLQGTSTKYLSVGRTSIYQM